MTKTKTALQDNPPQGDAHTEDVTVLHTDFYDVGKDNRYSGHYAVVQFQGQDKLSLLFASATQEHDSVYYINEKTNKPVFGEGVVASLEGYTDAIRILSSSKVARIKYGSKEFELLRHGIHQMNELQRHIDASDSCVIVKIHEQGEVQDVGPQKYLTGKFTIVTNFKRSGLHVVFETVADISGSYLPPRASVERVYVDDNEVIGENGKPELDENGYAEVDMDMTVYDMKTQFSLHYSDLLIQDSLFRTNHPHRGEPNLPVFNGAISQIKARLDRQAKDSLDRKEKARLAKLERSLG